MRRQADYRDSQFVSLAHNWHCEEGCIVLAGRIMSTYEEATKELACIRRQFKLSPKKTALDRSGQVLSSTDDTFLSSDMPNRSIDRLIFSSSASSLPPQLNKRTSPLRSNLSYSQLKDSYFASSRKNSLTQSGGEEFLTNSFRSPGTNAGPTTSVIEAFRQLQNEVKALEAERFEALREKEELRNRIMDGKRNVSLSKHRRELEETEKELFVKAHHDRLLRECDELRMSLLAKEEIFDSLQRKLQAQQHIQHSLEEDLHRYEKKLVAMEKSSSLLRRELKEITGRSQNVEQVIISSPEVRHTKTNRIEHTINSLQDQIEKINVGKMKAQAKLTSLRSYLDLILKINGELCETLLSREAAKREVMRLTHAITPPRYTWPKEVPYHDILHAVNESAKWTAEAAVEHAALKVTESALNNVIRTISPPRSRSRSRSHLCSARKGEVANTTVGSSYLDDSDSDVEEAHRRGRSVNRSLRVPTSNFTKLAASSYIDEVDDNQSYHYDDNGDGSDDRSSDVENHNDIAHRHQTYQQSLQELLQNENEEDSKKNKSLKRKVKKSGQKSKFPLSPNCNESSSLTKKHTAENATSLQRLLSDVRRNKSLQKAILRQAAVTNATRFAATASNSVKFVDGNKSSASPLNRNTSTSLHSRKAKLAKEEELLPTNKVAFVPSSSTGSTEFNIVASVSRASRATKELNAAVASRVRSFHSGGAGELLEETPRTTLTDLQHQLKAVKVLRKSFEL